MLVFVIEDDEFYLNMLLEEEIFIIVEYRIMILFFGYNVNFVLFKF